MKTVYFIEVLLFLKAASVGRTVILAKQKQEKKRRKKLIVF